MDQPPTSDTPRGPRPQLFSTASSAASAARRAPEPGPGILATIDGRPRRASARDGRLRQRIGVLGLLLAAAAAAYVGIKFRAARVAAPAVEVAAVPPQALVKPVLPLPQAASPVVAQGPATIETVPLPAQAAASQPVAAQAEKVNASLQNIQQALDRSEPLPSASPSRPKEEPVRMARAAAPAAVSLAAAPAAKPHAKAVDTDAELLAAMLPHLKRSGAPSSPAYEKECGQLSGSGAVECRARFCSARQGSDLACPAPDGIPR